MSRTGVPCYKPAARQLNSINAAYCCHCGKKVFVNTLTGDPPKMKNFCGWACSIAYDKTGV